jgi:hypothetical protein
MSLREWRPAAIAALVVGSTLASIGGLAAGPVVSGEPALWHFGVDHGTWTRTPSAGVDYDEEIDLEESERGGAMVVWIDLDGDGAKESFIRTACGNGGCEYPIFRGRGGKALGSVFGSAVWVLASRVHGMPAIRTYSHVQSDRGTVARYDFDGTSYRAVGSSEIDGEQYDALLRDLAQVPKP